MREFTYKNKTLSIAEWSRATGIPYPTLLYRLNRAPIFRDRKPSPQAVARALETPVGPSPRALSRRKKQQDKRDTARVKRMARRIIDELEALA